MSSFTLRIWDDESDKVTFYTVHLDEHLHSEMDKFLLKYGSDEQYKEYIQELSKFLANSIGKNGALDMFFNRAEQKAYALPPKGKLEAFTLGFPLRLYCYRVSKDIVILFNGGVKTAQTAQGSPDLNMKFIDAQHFVKCIEDAFRDNTIKIDKTGRTIIDSNSPSEEIILP